MGRLAFFLRLLTWFSLRHLNRQRWRAVAVLLGIALGAAVFTSVRLAINASMDSFSRSIDYISGKADWVVLRPGGRVPEDLVVQLLRHPAVRSASPLMTTYVSCAARQGDDFFLLIGLDALLDRPLRAWQSAGQTDGTAGGWLDLLHSPATLLLGKALAERLHAQPGSRIALEHVQRIQPFEVAGVLTPSGLALVEGGQVAITDLATFQEFTGVRGEVDRIDVLLHRQVRTGGAEAIRALLPAGVTLEAPGESKESGRMMIRAYQMNLSVLSFVSLFVGMFLVYSLVALNGASRRHELAVLRSLGSSSRLLFALFLAEGAFFGVCGWVIAIPLGSFMVELLLKRISQTITTLFVRVQVDRITLDPSELVLSLVTTVAIAVLAAYHPAREAMRVSPQEALLMHHGAAEGGRRPRRLALAALLLIGLVWPLAQVPGAAGMPIPGYIATFLLFSGFSLLSPALLRLIGFAAPNLLGRWAGHPAYLAGRYLRDAGTRTAISVGALITAMALFVALAIMIHSFRLTVEQWVHQTISGDLFVRPHMADVNQYRDPLPEEVVETLRGLANHLDVLPYRRIYLHYGIVPYQFEAIDLPLQLKHGGFLFVAGDPQQAIGAVAAGRGVLVSEVFANRTGIGPGHRFRARIADSDLDSPVVGVIRDYRTHGGVVYASLQHYQDQSGDRLWNGVRLFFREPPVNAEAAGNRLRNDILGCCGGRFAIEATLGSELRNAILRIFDETFTITTVLLVIALLVATLGITTTLTVLVLERMRLLNTLVAVGAGFAQIRAMIFWEAVLMVAAGEVIGLACGFSLSRLLIFVINRQSFGWTFLYRVDWGSIALALPLILATALLAALPASQLALWSPPALLLRER